jgi:hypothetical protein
MAKCINNDLFSLSGKVGNVIISQRFGNQYIRIKPSFIRDAKSPKQVEQRNRFAATYHLVKRSHDEVLKQIWNKGVVKMSGYNLFVKTNIGVFDEEGEITDYNKLILSVGKLRLPYEFMIEAKVEDNCVITISWENGDFYSCNKSDDRLKITAIINSEIVQVMGLTARRGDKTATFQLPCGSGAIIHLYVYFYNEDTMDGSHSYYQLVEVPN